MTDLDQLITKIFDEEYDPNLILRRCQARQSRQSFNINDDDLGMHTELPGRLFEILETFVASMH